MTSLEDKAKLIIVQQSNKNDVLDIIGRPSTVSLFDSNDWFYIEREKINQSVFKLGKSKINKNNVLEISFNEYGIVETKKLINIDNMNKLKVEKKLQKKITINDLVQVSYLKVQNRKLIRLKQKDLIKKFNFHLESQAWVSKKNS